MKLLNTDIIEINKSIKAVSNSSSMVADRITEVLKIICSCLKVELDWWHYYGETRGSHQDGGSFLDNWDNKQIPLYTVLKDKDELQDFDYWEFLGQFKTEWLTMDDEDIKEQINKQVSEEIEYIEKQKLEKQKIKEDKKNKKQEVLKKLSDEDRKILGLK